MNIIFEPYSSQNILGRKNKEYTNTNNQEEYNQENKGNIKNKNEKVKERSYRTNNQEEYNQENKGNINNKNEKVKERSYRTPEQQEGSNKINISSNINNENKIRYNENSIIKSNEKKIKIKFIYINEENFQRIEKEFYFLPSESIKDHYEEIKKEFKKEFNLDINNFYYNQNEIKIDNITELFDGMEIEID